MHILLLFLSLGLAYAGSNREDVLSYVLPVLSDSKSSIEVSVLDMYPWTGLLEIRFQMKMHFSEPFLASMYSISIYNSDLFIKQREHSIVVLFCLCRMSEGIYSEMCPHNVINIYTNDLYRRIISMT